MQRTITREEKRRYFGVGARDGALGSDIDLYFETAGRTEETLERELNGVRQRRLGRKRSATVAHRSDASSGPPTQKHVEPA